jgi:hypothetical protein
MNLLTARGAANALKDPTTLTAAYATYAASHDDKHRKSTAAYGYNHAGATGDEPAGYYQVTKKVSRPDGPIREEKVVWGQVQVSTFALDEQDLTVEDEKRMLLAAFASGGTCCAHKNPTRFHFVADMSAGYKGLLFRGGGKVYPKIADPVEKIVIVVQAGGANLAIVTHFPDKASVAASLAPLS